MNVKRASEILAACQGKRIAGVVVGKMGTAVVTREELAAEFSS